MKILCIGDIFGRAGREILRARLLELIARYAADFVIVNGENAAAGRGITRAIADELLALPIDVLTSGNHIWQKDEIHAYLQSKPILRPHNAAGQRPGSGVGVYTARNRQRVAVVNLQGRIHMYEGDKMASPFLVGKELVAHIRQDTPIIIVDFHAEITAEKQALGRWLDGQVSCVYGTHTHVQTADEQIFPGGTAYITDIGMTGPHDSIIGMRCEDALRRFLSNGEDKRWKPADGGARIHGICVTVDPTTGRALAIERIREES